MVIIFSLLSYVLVTTSPESDEVVCKKIQALPEILEFHTISGDYSAIAKIKASDTDSIGNVVMKKIRTLPGVVYTETLFVMKFSISSPLSKEVVLRSDKITEFILVKTHPKKDITTYDRLQKLPEITEAHMVLGEYDVIGKVEVQDINIFINEFMAKVRKVPGVTSAKPVIKRTLL